MNRKEAIDFIKEQPLDAFLNKARKKGWICPICENGTGKDGDGIVYYKKIKKYKCFKCGFCGDVFDLIGEEFNLPEFNDQIQKAAEIYGVTIEKDYSTQTHSLKKPKTCRKKH